MPDDSSPPPQGLMIPSQTRKDFPHLTELIVGSQSMNDEERQYWINILPSMKPEQRENLQEILETEKRQLAAIEKKYDKKKADAEKVEEKKKTAPSIEERKEHREELREEEAEDQEKESKEEEELLKEIEGM